MIIDGINVEIVRKKVKNVSLKIRNRKPLVTCPYRVDDDYIVAFVKSKKSWLEKQLEKEKNRPKITFCPQNGEHVTLLSHDFVVKVINSEKSSIKIQENYLVFFEKDEKNREKNYKKWLKKQLEKVIEKLLNKWQNHMHIKYNGFSVKKVKSRWGWCNTKSKILGFNLMLLFQKKEAVEYVVVHELAHLFERGHNKKFYSIIAECLPDYKIADKSLVMPLEK